MSLKAKLEAVIYAAEEPVTLNQLAALFAVDALEWKATREAAAAEQAAELAAESPSANEPLPLLAEGLEYLGLVDTPASDFPAPSPGPDPATEDHRQEAPSVELPAAAETVTAAIEGSEASPAESPTESPADSEAESKRLARLRDREVRAILKQLLEELIAGYSCDGRGLEIREIAGGYRMATKPECHDAVRLFVKSLKPPLKLSLPALETLAVIAYKQPVTAPEVNEIRGVESSGVLGSLLARKLIATAGRKQVIGRPILYKTTREFLLRFGLKDVSELPSMEEFEKMAASELDDAVQENTDSGGGPPIGDLADQNTAPNLESDSPSGEELAAAAEAAQPAHRAEACAAETADEQGQSAESGASADSHSPDPGLVMTVGPAYPPVEPAPSEAVASKPDSEKAEQA